MTRRTHLAYLADIPGMSRGAWRHPEVNPADASSLQAYQSLAQTAERGCFDLFFKADVLGANTEDLDMWSEWPHHHLSKPEPLTLMSAVAAATKHIGIGVTVSTTFAEPFHIARSFATLDHISGGRAAWNVVTSAADHAARNFGSDKLPAHSERYEMAKESVEVVTSYWDTWEDDAFIFDKENARSFDPAKFHPTDHEGKFFKAHGGLSLPRSPQGHPVIIQAGASPAGRELAAETAQIVYGTGSNLDAAKQYYDDVKSRMEKYDRDVSSLKILSGIEVVVGETETEAQEKKEFIDSLVTIQARLRYLSDGLDETDLSDLPLDEPIPADRIPSDANLHTQYVQEIRDLVDQGLTLREVATRYNRAKNVVVGSVEQVADHLEHWVRGGASDGFMLSGLWNPGNLEDFVNLVIPELQKRGMVRTSYEGTTLRDHLGIARPVNRHTA